MDLEIEVLSAKDLTNVRNLWIRKMKVYAVVSISSNQNEAKRTPVDWHNGTNPIWNYFVTVQVDDKMLQGDYHLINIRLFCQRTKGDRFVGRIMVPISKLFEQAKGSNTPRFETCNVIDPNNDVKGTLVFSYRFCKLGTGCSGPSTGNLAQKFSSADVLRTTVTLIEAGLQVWNLTDKIIGLTGGGF